MEIKYDAYWRTENSHIRITHGTITESDLEEIIEEIIERKERDESSQVEGWTFECSTIDSFEM